MSEEDNDNRNGFDKSDIYHEKVEPLIRQIHDICEQNGIGMVSSFTTGLEEVDGSMGFRMTSTSTYNASDSPEVNAPSAYITAQALFHGYTMEEIMLSELASSMGVDINDLMEEIQNDPINAALNFSAMLGGANEANEEEVIGKEEFPDDVVNKALDRARGNSKTDNDNDNNDQGPTLH